MKEQLIKKLRESFKRLMDLPYGTEIRGGEKILAPNYNHYAREVDVIIDMLVKLYQIDKNTILISEIEQLRSIRDNEINKILLNKPQNIKRFYNGYIDEELQEISKMILSILSNLLLE